MVQFPVLYPNAEIVRLALRGAATYRLSWFDAHLWAYAEHFGLAELWSEDFQHDRLYGTVRAVNPLLDSGSWVVSQFQTETLPDLDQPGTSPPPPCILFCSALQDVPIVQRPRIQPFQG